MATDINALTTDMLRFADLLKFVARPGPEVSVGFEDKARSLHSDPSLESVIETAEWLYEMLRHTGNGSIFDRYVSGVEYGSVDNELTDEYLRLASQLRNFGQSHMGNSILSNSDTNILRARK